MRAISTAVSLTAHVVIVGAALWTTVDARPHVARPPIIIDEWPSPAPAATSAPWEWAPIGPVIEGEVSIPVIAAPIIDGINVRTTAAPAPLAFGPVIAPGTSGSEGPIEASLVDQLPMILTGPVPTYPDLLRQAGIQGWVLLEAVVDTTGHVEPGSIVVVETAHAGFVASARQAIAATLFRPATVRGRAVRVRVRIPMEFTLRR